MQTVIYSSPEELGREAALAAGLALREALDTHGQANLIVATGASQFETLAHLIREPGIAWERVTAFHLDEYVGLPVTHPASFRRYLWERFASCLPSPLRAFHYIAGDAPDPRAECARLASLIGEREIDLALIGIGENGHLAFNDPPADFSTREPYLIVELDKACRLQQVGEGWFADLEEVPARAISMSCREVLRSRQLIISCPDSRKARAVMDTARGPVRPDCPASILQTHPNATLFLDRASAALLTR